MRRTLLLLAMALSLTAGVLLQAADDFVTSRFSDYLDALRAQAGIPGLAVALVRPTDPDWERAYGRQDVEQALATRPDTPFELDGTTQIVSSAIVLRCVEEGRLSLDDRVASYSSNRSATDQDANATLRQVMTHTTIGPEGPVFTYRPERLDSLVAPIAVCTGKSFRDAVTDVLERFAMIDSVPGEDVIATIPSPTGMTAAMLERFAGVLERLAKPYAVDTKGRTTPSEYVASTLTPASGLISTVRDMARFDVALRKGVLVQPESLAQAWNTPVDLNGLRLPHGLGWFVQFYNGERIVWQFGVSDNASSSMVITVPGRGLTLILLANSQGLARPFALATGDVMVSPFARLFLSIFVR